MRFLDTKLTLPLVGLPLSALGLAIVLASPADARKASKQAAPRLCRAASSSDHVGFAPQHAGIARRLLNAMRRAKLHRARRRS